MSQSDSTERPMLHFLRATPERLMSRPPLCSSLQSVESSFMLVALDRFPHALVTCASAIESSMKSVLVYPPENRIPAARLYAKVRKRYPGLESFDERDLEDFRLKRNEIAHYGFSPRDDEPTATLLLKTGFPFLTACYSEFFGFDLVDGLAIEFGDNFKIALNVYNALTVYKKTKEIPEPRFSRCFSAFSHLIRWSLRQSIMAEMGKRCSYSCREPRPSVRNIRRKEVRVRTNLRDDMELRLSHLQRCRHVRV